MVVFLPPDFEAHLKIDYSRVKVIHMNATDLKWYFPYYERVQQIRTSHLWKEQGETAGWLIKSPQAALEGYNPLVMIKLKMLQDAARLNPWGEYAMRAAIQARLPCNPNRITRSSFNSAHLHVSLAPNTTLPYTMQVPATTCGWTLDICAQAGCPRTT